MFNFGRKKAVAETDRANETISTSNSADVVLDVIPVFRALFRAARKAGYFSYAVLEPTWLRELKDLVGGGTLLSPTAGLEGFYYPKHNVSFLCNPNKCMFQIEGQNLVVVSRMMIDTAINIELGYENGADWNDEVGKFTCDVRLRDLQNLIDIPEIPYEELECSINIVCSVKKVDPSHTGKHVDGVEVFVTLIPPKDSAGGHSDSNKLN